MTLLKSKEEPRIVTVQSADDEELQYEAGTPLEDLVKLNYIAHRNWQREMVSSVIRSASFHFSIAGLAILLSAFLYCQFCDGEGLTPYQYIFIVVLAASLFCFMWSKIINVIRS